MIKRICDKCGRETKTSYVSQLYEYGYEKYGFRNDLCLECAIKVQQFIVPSMDDDLEVEQKLTMGEILIMPNK